MTGYSSNDKRSFDVIAILCAVVLDFVMPIAAEMIEPEAVCVQIDDVQQASLQCNELRGIHLALKNRVLDALTEVEARLGGPAQARLSSGSGGRNIVGNEDIHGFEI